ncbi:hypothetical protein CDAR_244161 [Caerostris darwini]|uniref:Uncharacterized protein n=1 Tax=Caerostris darwini TaxID=1538125 RepID=A0AAV4RFV3_9ARAC|nr:hypothetical protein CDAR_244161 [Caerostris darwini]
MHYIKSSKHKIYDLHCIKTDEKPYIIAFAENLNHKYEVPSLCCSGILCGNLLSPGRGSTWTHSCCQIRTTGDHPETWKPGGTGFENNFKSCYRLTGLFEEKPNYDRIIRVYNDTEQHLKTSIQLREME